MNVEDPLHEYGRWCKPILEDGETGKQYETALQTMDLLNTLHEENELLKDDVEMYKNTIENFTRLVKETSEENEQLKQTMQEVAELLSEEVDLFSDKATEHDINAYIELKELDNKDAYYMAVSTKEAIKMLKGGDVE